jgi:hypothetical protein
MTMTNRTLFTALFLLTLGLAGSQSASAATTAPAVTPAPSPAASAATAAPAAATASPVAEDPAITAAVKKQFLAWQVGAVDRTLYDAEMNKGINDAIVAQISSQLQSLGAPAKFTYVDRVIYNDNRVYVYAVETAKAKVRMQYALDAAGKISGLYFRAAP